MSNQMKRGFLMSLPVLCMLLLYMHFPNYQGVIVFSSIFGLAAKTAR